MYKVLLFIILLSEPSFGKLNPNNLKIELEGEEAMNYLTGKNGSGGAIGGKGCFSTMLDNTSQGMGATLEAQTNHGNVLIALSKQYFEHEQSCGNQLAEAKLELDSAETDHENMAASLPLKIQQQQLEYEQAVLAVKQDCEQSSGGAFQQWKVMKANGVVTPARGGPMALFGRGQNINKFRKLFYDDCLASENNIARVQNLSKQLAINVDMAKLEVENSARKLASLSSSLSFKQGLVVKNCVEGKKQLDYQAQIARNNAEATNTMAKRNNLMRMLHGVGTCISGAQGASGFLPASSGTQKTSN